MGYPANVYEIINALLALNREENMTDEEYIKNVIENEIALKVKIADLKHDMTTARLGKKCANSKDLSETVVKYNKILRELIKANKKRKNIIIKNCKCGESPIIQRNINKITQNSVYCVCCKKCHTHTANYISMIDAISSWNENDIVTNKLHAPSITMQRTGCIA